MIIALLTITMAFAGLMFGLLYFATLKRSVALFVTGGWFDPVALTLGRIGAVVGLLFLAAKLGAAPLLAAFIGFLLARSWRCTPKGGLADASLAAHQHGCFSYRSGGDHASGGDDMDHHARAGSRLPTCHAPASMLPDRRQAVLEVIVTGIAGQIEDVLRKDARPFLPLAHVVHFSGGRQSLGRAPGRRGANGQDRDPRGTRAHRVLLGALLRNSLAGFRGYLASFAEPRLIMLPLNILSEITRTFSLMVRLFGNVMSGEFVIGLVVALAGLFVPVPLMALEILVGLVQAYIFTVLATVFIGAAVGGVETG